MQNEDRDWEDEVCDCGAPLRVYRELDGVWVECDNGCHAGYVD